jgi:DNA invertase Pin-like site-specific DNA recombinase
MRAIGYFRESPEGGETLAQQNKAFLEYCAHHGLEAAGTFADTAAANGHGQGFRELIAHLRHGDETTVVVVPSLMALGSSVGNIARRYFQIEGLGVRVAPMDGVEDATAELVTLWSAQAPGAHAGDRVRAAMRRKAVKGEVLGRPPYGYKVGSRRRLELIPEEAVVVRYIFRLYLNEGLGIRLIARRLNEEGLKTRRGGNWSMVSIRDILRNRVYLGTYSRFGVRVAGSHPTLVSAEDFRVVQDRLNARRTSYKPRVTSRFLLSGIAHCGYCGNKLIGVSRKQSWKRRSGERVENSYRYYQCESRTNQSVCNYHTRRAEALEGEVRAALDRVLAEAQEPAPSTATDRRAAGEADRARLAGRLRALDKRIGKYVEAAARGALTKDTMRKLSVKAASDRLAVEDALVAAERDARGEGAEGVAPAAAAGRRLVDGWDTMPFADRHAALREAVSRITVSDEVVGLDLR